MIDLPHALVLADVFQRLGGSLAIEGGRRSIGRPLPDLFSISGRAVPQLPGAEPQEQFHSVEQWHGAMKLVEYLLTRLEEADKEAIFTLLASVNAGSSASFDFREMMQ